MTEYDDGRTGPLATGLPGPLPAGERILWQGGPDRRVLARTALHTWLIGGYFAVLAGWAVVAALVRGVASVSDLAGAASTLAVGVAALGLLHLLAWAVARSTIYTLTDRRLVLRIGVAVPKCINLPLGMIEAVDLAIRADGTGDLPLRLRGTPKLGYLALWPHARAWRIVRPEPMLRAVADAQAIAALLARACAAAAPVAAAPPRAPAAAPAPAIVAVAA